MKKLFFLSIVLVYCAVTTTVFSANTTTGVIQETMDSGGYTYVQVNIGADKQWVALPESTVKKGEKITYHNGMTMHDFYSKTLDRTFAAIVFSPGLVKEGAANNQETEAEDSFAAAVAQENQEAHSNLTSTGASGGSSGAIVPDAGVEVAKASGANSFTVEELFTKARELDKKEIRVRGQVVKFTPSIMGRNWIHLQDGTGNPMHNTHDLVLTSQATVKVGDTITFTGVVAADRDFGAGYSYKVLIEQAEPK